VIQVVLSLGSGDNAAKVIFTPYTVGAQGGMYPYLESITDFRESVSNASARQPRNARGQFISGDIGAAETPSVTVGLYNRQNELWALVGLLRRTPLHVIVDGEVLFSGLVTKQILGATMTLEASS
jgi:hypothetical protein